MRLGLLYLILEYLPFNWIIIDRGFSFNSNIKLDMRMGKNKISAYELLNEAPLEDLSSIIKIFGEDKDHKKIAKEIVRTRDIKPIHSTQDLCNAILKAKGNKYFKKNPCYQNISGY